MSLLLKTCRTCQQELSFDSFHKSKENQYGLNDHCKACRKINQANKYRTNWFKHFTIVKKSYCKKRNIPFNLTDEYLKNIWTENCPVFGTKFIMFDKSPQSPSLDRLNKDLGYLQGNVCFISARANLIKSDASLDDLKRVVNWYEGATTIPSGSTSKWMEAVYSSKEDDDIVCST